jgi:nitrate reductase gamma subunit
MSVVLYGIAYLAAGIFIIAVIARTIMWAKMPLHLRWELYPVAHEAGRAQYGGSYLEESEWWTKPRETSLWGDLKMMVPEIVFLVALKEHNPKLWVRSYPFHFGLYLMTGCAVVMGGVGILAAVWPAVLAGGLGVLAHYAVLVLGVGGLCLGFLGALGLLHRRLSDPDLRDFTSGADIFNLVFFVAAFGTGLLTFIVADRDFSTASFFVNNLVLFKMGAIPGAGLKIVLPVLTVVLLSVLLAYIPLTHMSHFIGKYFAYHSIRWNDKPNLRGGSEEATIGKLLRKPVSWAAPHIRGDGKRTWADVATELPKEEPKK